MQLSLLDNCAVRKACGMHYSVSRTHEAVSAWSETRLSFEPKGWQSQFRNQLRSALRELAGATGNGLLAEYDAPDGAAVDVENVLIYNVGPAVFGPLIRSGLTCRRGRSTDGRHHVRYRLVADPPNPGHGLLVGRVVMVSRGRLPATAGEWWAELRPNVTTSSHAVAGHGAPAVRRFSADVTVSGPGVNGRKVANMMKPLLDGLISCFHVHDGSQPDQLRDRLGSLGPADETWRWLTDPSTAVLGVRPLVRPYRQGVAWNPADDRCEAFRIRTVPDDRLSVHAHVYARGTSG